MELAWPTHTHSRQRTTGSATPSAGLTPAYVHHTKWTRAVPDASQLSFPGPALHAETGWQRFHTGRPSPTSQTAWAARMKAAT